MDDLPARRSFLSSLHNLSWRVLDAMDGIARGVWAGVWLGLLTRDALHDLDATYYSRSNNYLSLDHNLGGLYRWEEHAVDSFFEDCRHVVLLGAGAGREMTPLAERGMKVDAYECHPGLRGAGNQRLGGAGAEAAIQPMDRDQCPNLGRSYDGVIVGWGMYSLIQGQEQRIQLLRDLRSSAKPGAPMLVSFYVLAGPRRPYRVAAGLANVTRRILGRKPVEYGDFLSPGYGHFFTREEIEEELNQAGWNLEFFDRRTYPHGVAIAVE